MADHTATLAVNLEDGVTAPALTATKALEQLQDQLAADTKALAQMQRAMKNLQGGNYVNIAQYRKLQAGIEKNKQAVSQGTASILALGGSLTRTAPKVDKTASLLEQLTKQALQMPGPMSGLVTQFAQLGGLLAGGAIAAGVLAIVAALVALTAAGVAATVMLVRYGIAQADARRSELLRLEGLTKMRFWYRAAAGSATELQDTVDRVSDSSALGRGELLKYTEQLYRMGLRGDNLSEALEGVAIKAVTQGDAAAQAFAGMAAGAALTGRSVHAMTEKVRSRLGAIATAKLLALDVQVNKLRESFDALFRDLRIDGLLAGLREVFKIFSQTTATGQTLKRVLEALIQPLINSLATAGPYVKRFVQGLLLGFIDVAIATVRLVKIFRKVFGDKDTTKGIETMTSAVWAGQAAVYGLAGAFGVAAAGLVLITSPLWGAVALLYGLWKIVKALYGFLVDTDWGAAAKALGLMFYDIGDTILELDWAAIGWGIVAGIVEGLKQAGLAILGPGIRGAAALSIAAFKHALRIESPSKVFAKLGMAIPQGVAQGVEQGTPAAQGAVAGMVEPPAAGGGAGGGRAGATVSIGELHFHANDGQSKTMAQDFRRELESVLEGLAISLGAPVPGAA